MEYRIGERQLAAGSRYLTLELHASLVSTTDRYRLSSDTRYQRASEPMDDRWAGAAPAGHSAFWQPGAPLEPVEVSRRRWGI